MSIKKRKVEPDTTRLIEGLRDTGYTFPGAIADIVDNSITAGAEAVNITVGFSIDGAVQVLIADNGIGMSESGLENAMRYGSKRQPRLNSLSKFGLGLKTASTSFCRKLVVMSNQKPSDPVNYACWDLDNVAAVGDWELAIGSAAAPERDIFEDELEKIAQLSKSSRRSGTVVQWSHVDRLVKTRRGEDPANPRNHLKRQILELSDHLSMVFQRFLDPNDKRARNVRIWLNDKPIQAWDPFCTAWVAPKLQKVFTFEGAGGKQEKVLLRAYILPAPNEIDDEAYKAASKNRAAKLQGIYLYRENRLIEGPGWMGFGERETHNNNLRIELSFPGELDEPFGVDVKKSKVHMSPALIMELSPIITPIRREADTQARGGATRNIVEDGGRVLPTEITIKRTIDSLKVAGVVAAEDGSVSIDNNAGKMSVMDSAGNQVGPLRVRTDAEDTFVDRRVMLEDGCLWEPYIAKDNGKIGVAINAGHDWYRKAYMRCNGDSVLVQALEYLIFALAQAEANNTKMDLNDVYREFRIEVGQNLRKLVKDLPDSDDATG